MRPMSALRKTDIAHVYPYLFFATSRTFAGAHVGLWAVVMVLDLPQRVVSGSLAQRRQPFKQPIHYVEQNSIFPTQPASNHGLGVPLLSAIPILRPWSGIAIEIEARSFRREPHPRLNAEANPTGVRWVAQHRLSCRNRFFSPFAVGIFRI